MKTIESQGMRWLQFELLLQFSRLKHGIFLRHGGSSTGAYASLNVSENVGDSPQSVKENRTRIQKALQLKELITSQQVHGKQLEEVTSNNQTCPKICDGLITSLEDVGLMIQHADCQVALFYDPVNHVAAGIHCGWRGSVQNIYAEAIVQMRQKYDTSPKNLYVGISPSLGPHYAEFINYKMELPEEFQKFQVKPNYFDFWEISRIQLQNCGVLPEHIQIAQECTFGVAQNYFSYRREKITGRHGTVIALSAEQ